MITVHTCMYANVLAHTTQWPSFKVHCGMYHVHNGTKQYNALQHGTSQFDVSSKKLQTGLELEILCILSKEHTTALQGLQHKSHCTLMSDRQRRSSKAPAPGHDVPRPSLDLDLPNAQVRSRARFWPANMPAYRSPILKETSNWKLARELLVYAGWPDNYRATWSLN